MWEIKSMKIQTVRNSLAETRLNIKVESTQCYLMDLQSLWHTKSRSTGCEAGKQENWNIKMAAKSGVKIGINIEIWPTKYFWWICCLWHSKSGSQDCQAGTLGKMSNPRWTPIGSENQLEHRIRLHTMFIMDLWSLWNTKLWSERMPWENWQIQDGHQNRA